MKLIHTADWHLGRLFYHAQLTRDQEQVLAQLTALVAEVRPAAVLVAGDIYDRAVPPTEAVKLLDEVLSQIVVGLGVPVIAIAGNHDSAARVGFASSVLRERGLYLFGELSGSAAPVTLHDEHGPVHVHALPFADAAQARYAYGDETLRTQEDIAAAGVARALNGATRAERHVALAHAFVAGGSESESERPLSVGGSSQVPADVFRGFDYVALGHLHRAQRCGSDTVRYAGSPMKYSFSEHDHRKSVSVVEIGAPGSGAGTADGAGSRAAVTVETVPLIAPRDVRRLTGTLADILEQGRTDAARDDYVLAALLDPGALLDPIGRLRTVYPNTLAIERPLYEQSGEERLRPRPGAAADLDLFAAFFSYAAGEALSEPQRTQLESVVDGLERRRRESAP